ncbi:MAG: hypothetical protein ACLQBD_09675 [Syntrophobacteraceae bacterium]
MHEDLWAGVELKIESADFFLKQMWETLAPPERTQINVALESSGAIIETRWQPSFYAYLDAFLAMVRSIPDIVQACFGEDKGGPMKDWLEKLDLAELCRRIDFSKQFKKSYNKFKNLPLSNARNISLHRMGFPPVQVHISGRFGMTYTGTPIEPVPSAESPKINAGDGPSSQWAHSQPPVPLQPAWSGFLIDGKTLLPECQTYLQDAKNLVDQARRISQRVHGSNDLTRPPS